MRAEVEVGGGGGLRLCIFFRRCFPIPEAKRFPMQSEKLV